jgi:hypothetical protein
LPEQWERAVAAIQDLPPRTALLKRRGAPVAQVQTVAIPRYRLEADRLDQLIRDLVKLHGVPVADRQERSAPEPTPIQYSDWERGPGEQTSRTGGVIFPATGLPGAGQADRRRYEP